jgi:hypothetical protein
LPLDRFGERFALAALVGQMANIVFDAAEVDGVAEGTLKWSPKPGQPIKLQSCP